MKNEVICSICHQPVRLVEGDNVYKHYRPVKHQPVPVQVQVRLVNVLPDFLEELVAPEYAELARSGAYEFYCCAAETGNAAGRLEIRRRVKKLGLSFEVTPIALPLDFDHYLTRKGAIE